MVDNIKPYTKTQNNDKDTLIDIVMMHVKVKVKNAKYRQTNMGVKGRYKERDNVDVACDLNIQTGRLFDNLKAGCIDFFHDPRFL